MHSRFPFLALAIGLIVLVLASQGEALLFIQLPGLAFVVSLTCLGLLASFGPTLVLGAISDAARRDATHRERVLHLRVWNRAHGLAWGSGVIASMCSVALLLANLSDPELLLPSVAMCFMPMFWAAILAELLFAPLGAWVERANEEPLTAATHNTK